MQNRTRSHSLAPFAGSISSQYHIMGIGLSLAMILNRVYLPIYSPDTTQWTDSPWCPPNATHDACYFRPFSRCTLKDAGCATLPPVSPLPRRHGIARNSPPPTWGGTEQPACCSTPVTGCTLRGAAALHRCPPFSHSYAIGTTVTSRWAMGSREFNLVACHARGLRRALHLSMWEGLSGCGLPELCGGLMTLDKFFSREGGGTGR
jgi:hypothetical protein